MTLTCCRCGRTGERGFWISKTQYPTPNRILCNNDIACEKRRKKREAA